MKLTAIISAIAFVSAACAGVVNAQDLRADPLGGILTAQNAPAAVPAPDAAPAAPAPARPDAAAASAAAADSVVDSILQAPKSAPKAPAAEPPAAVRQPKPPAGDVVVAEPLVPEKVVKAEPGVGAAVAAGMATTDVEVASTTVGAEELVRRRAREIEAEQDLKMAEESLLQEKYQEALNYFQSAEKNLSPRPANARDRARAKEGQSLCEYYLALEAVRKGDLPAGRDMATQSFRRSPDFKPAAKLAESIRRRIEEQEKLASSKRVVRGTAPDYRQKVADVRRLLNEGVQHMRVREYAQAEAKFKQVLAMDPANTRAMELLRSLAHERESVSAVERKATAASMIADVKAAWNPRDYATFAPKEEGGAPRPAGEPRANTRAELIKKMQNIIIPEIKFRQANIHDVVEYLVAQSIAYDTTTEDESKKGVNIILNLGETGGAPAGGAAGGAAPKAGGTEDFGFGAKTEEAVPTATAGNVITLKARYISLFHAVRIICEVAKLKYRIEENSVVMIVPADAPDQEIVVRMYPVEPPVIARIRTETGGGGGAAGADTTISAGELPQATGDLQKYFNQMGVPFPKGSSVTYNPTISTLIVANTPDNLTVFEQILDKINKPPSQVEIEARFVEVSQRDLQEMGLEWILTDDWELMQKKGTGPLDSRPRIQMNRNDSAGFTKGVRQWSAPGSGDAIVPAANGTLGDILSFSSVLTNPELTVVLHALEQSGHADLLSAPKITTQAGQEATIKVVTEYIYPTSFSVEGGTTTLTGTGLGTSTSPVVVPEDFETREVGVILVVNPEVSPGGTMINLTMSPEVVSEPEFKDYGYTYFDNNNNEVHIPMPQPFFHTRTITTQIQIYDGATVVMGGLINENMTSYDDRIPVLGDIPVLGRLFRTKGMRSDKRNLLIFVTARLVDPAGKAVNSLKQAAEARMQAAGKAGAGTGAGAGTQTSAGMTSAATP